MTPTANLYFPNRPVRAERFRAGMDTLLGRPVVTIHGKTTVAPHSLADELHDGCWAVETTERYTVVNGKRKRDGYRLAILTDAEFRSRYRLAN